MSVSPQNNIGNNLAVVLISQFNELSKLLIEKIVKNNISVVVLDNENEWKGNFGNVVNVSFCNKKDWKRIVCGYLVYINQDDNFNKTSMEQTRSDLLLVRNIIKKNQSKSLFALPLIKEQNYKNRLDAITNLIINSDGSNLASVRLGITQLQPNGLISNLYYRDLYSVLRKQPLHIPKSVECLYFTDMNDFVNLAIKTLFGFSQHQSTPAFTGCRVSLNEYIREINNLVGGVKIKRSNEIYKYENITVNKESKVDWKFNLRKDLKSIQSLQKVKFEEKDGDESSLQLKKSKLIIIQKLKNIISNIRVRIGKHTKTSNSPRRNNEKKVITRNKNKALATSIIFLVISPFILFTLSVSFLLLAVHSIKVFELKKAQQNIILSDKISMATIKQLDYYKTIPFAGKIYGPLYDYVKISNDSSKLLENVVHVLMTGEEFKDHFLSPQVYDISHFENTLSQLLDDIYVRSGFLINDIQDKRLINHLLSKKGIDIDKLMQKRGEYYGFKELIPKLTDFLGENKEKKYLIIFQNNMELRPTGGFIGSFAILNVEHGSMRDLNVFDVYDADGQLKGYVAPPKPIGDHLNSSGWYLRDSNWDPDFSNSAKAATWFLDKEMNIDVDGVVAVDLNFLDSLLAITGDVYLKDYGIIINQSNFYKVIQDEVENKFFPGSKTKSTIISSLSQELINRLSDQNTTVSKRYPIVLLTSLEDKSMQLFLDDADAQQTIKTLGWGGSMDYLACKGNCINDFVAEVEANLGVNKVNYFIKRTQKMFVEIDSKTVKRDLEINLENMAEKQTNNYPWYRVYLRVFVPNDVSFYPVSVSSGNQKEILEPDILVENGLKSAGVFVEIYPQKNAQINFSWTSVNPADMKVKGSYVIKVRKQAGVYDDPFNLKIENKNSSLTESSMFLYNTVLSRDFISRIYW